MGTEHLSAAADGFVIAMLVMMASSMGTLILLAVCMRRNVARRDREVDKLLEEVAAEDGKDKHAPTAREAPVSDPWEKDGDWWKQ